jgi:outer membrane lipoprotein-sorting protein
MSAAAYGMTAQEVIQNCVDQYKQGMQDIEDMTVFTNQGKTYSKRATAGGKEFYKTRQEIEIMNQTTVTIYDGQYVWYRGPTGTITKHTVTYNPYQMTANLLEASDLQYKGVEDIDGHKTYAIGIGDLHQLAGSFNTEARSDALESVEATGTLWIDANDWVIRKMQVTVDMVDEVGENRQFEYASRHEDFRKVNGLLMAYRTVTESSSLTEQLTPEQKQEMEDSLKQMQAQLAQMPESQRQMVEEMMKPQIEALEKVLGAEEIVREVEAVKINAGLPDNLFDGNAL